MEDAQKAKEVTIEEVNRYTANLFLRGKSTEQVKEELRAHGLDEQTIETAINNAGDEVFEFKKAKANKDMLYGGLWCIGGVVLTIAHIGYIFWGAIVFGAFQFFRGVVNSGK
jgi:hypothetical protein